MTLLMSCKADTFLNYQSLKHNKFSHSQFSYLFFYRKLYFKTLIRASLVAQWLRICLLMQGTRVRALVWEDPTCHGAAGPVSHNC